MTWERTGGQQRISPRRSRAWSKRCPGPHSGSITLPRAQGPALGTGGAREGHRKRRRPRAKSTVGDGSLRPKSGGQREPSRRGRPSVRNPSPAARATRKTERAASPEEKVKVTAPEVQQAERKTAPHPRLCRLTFWGGRLDCPWHLLSTTWSRRLGTLDPGAHDRPLAVHGLQPGPSAGRGYLEGGVWRAKGVAWRFSWWAPPCPQFSTPIL